MRILEIVCSKKLTYKKTNTITGNLTGLWLSQDTKYKKRCLVCYALLSNAPINGRYAKCIA